MTKRQMFSLKLLLSFALVITVPVPALAGCRASLNRLHITGATQQWVTTQCGYPDAENLLPLIRQCYHDPENRSPRNTARYEACLDLVRRVVHSEMVRQRTRAAEAERQRAAEQLRGPDGFRQKSGVTLTGESPSTSTNQTKDLEPESTPGTGAVPPARPGAATAQ